MKHILVTGCPRSGTTFLGTVLALPPEVGYIREPFNRQYGLDGLSHDFTYLYPGMRDEEFYGDLIQKLVEGRASFQRLPLKAEPTKRQLGRLLFKSGSNFTYLKAKYHPATRRYLLKDPMATLASQYFHRRFDMEVVVIVRHPIPILTSMRRVGTDHDLTDLISQPRLYQKYLKPILGKTDINRLPLLERQALLWTSLNLVLSDFVRNNPDFIVLRHKDIASKPFENFKRLYSRLGLEYTDTVDRRIQQLTDRRNIIRVENGVMHVLKRNSRGLITRRYPSFTAAEERLIHSLTDDVVKLFFPTTSWPQSPELLNFLPGAGESLVGVGSS